MKNSESADELQRLREENESLRQALAKAETRDGMKLASSFDWEDEKKDIDQVLEGLQRKPLLSRLGVSAGGHVALLVLTSLGFLFVTFRPPPEPEESAAAPAVESESPAAEEGGAPSVETPASVPEPTPTAAQDGTTDPGQTNTARARMEARLSETSPERPTESDLDLFGGDIDLDL